jgi:hypothetical protein
MDKLIPIEIVGAKLECLQVTFSDKEPPHWQAQVALIMQNKSQLTSIWVRSNEYDENKCAERSCRFVDLAGSLKNEITKLVTQHINKFQKTLEAPCES